jgi:hypothetical protein
MKKKATERPASLLAAIVVVIVILVLVVVTIWRRCREPRSRSGVGAYKGAVHRDTCGGAQEVAKFDWGGSSQCFPSAMIKECLAFVRGLPGFGPDTEAHNIQISAEAARLSALYGVELSASALSGMRRMEVALVVQRSGVKAQRFGEQISKAYLAGETVLSLAARYRLPPMATLRQILIECYGMSASEVKDAINDKTLMPETLRSQIDAVSQADMSSKMNNDVVRAEAQRFEDALGHYLKSRGVAAIAENELKERGAALTPDFLLNVPININGQLVYWIDAKNYTMYDSALVAASISRQATKYTVAFGPGAMVFSGGVMCGARLRSGQNGRSSVPLLLDGSHIKAAES